MNYGYVLTILKNFPGDWTKRLGIAIALNKIFENEKISGLLGGGQYLERPKCRTADISGFRNLEY